MNSQRTDLDDLRVAMQYLKKADPVLATLIDTNKTYSIYRRRTSFESLIRIVIGQQLSSQAAATIFGRVKALFQSSSITPEEVTRLSDETFGRAGVSRAKIATIRSLVSEITSGALNLRKLSYLTEDEITAALTRIQGVGPWTVQMYLMFVLRRLDIFPSSDKGIVNAIKRLYNSSGQHPDYERISSAWKPYRTVACWCLWRYLDRNGA